MYTVNCSLIIIPSVSAASYCASHEKKQVLQWWPQPLWLMQHNWHPAFMSPLQTQGFEFLKTICVCVCENVKMCVHWEVCEWHRGSSPEPAFLSTAVGRTISADSGRGSEISGLLPRTESGSFSFWQREVTGRQCTGDRQTASQRHLHSFRTPAYPYPRNTPSWNAHHPHSLSHTHSHNTAYVVTHAAHTYRKPWFQDWPLLEFIPSAWMYYSNTL